MASRLTIACVAALVLLAGGAPAAAQQNPFRLKETNQQKLCLTCHSDFEQKLKSRFVHSAVQAGECSGCHDLHVSANDKLLSGDARQRCASCHDSVEPAKPQSTHKVVADGQCEKCHDPHASDNPANLVAKVSDLCVSCHKPIGDAIKQAKFKHTPVEQGCLNCHLPHGSDKAPALLKTAVPALCLGCHKADSPSFVARHMKYPVAKARCTSCHDPHGSSQPALMLDTVHQPVATHACTQCHEAPDSATPFATKRAGSDLCKGCHTDLVNTVLGKARLHWPVVDRKGCINCHNPHASRAAKLLRAEMPVLCASCHPDTAKSIAATTVKHAPVDQGMCTGCHAPHGSSNAYLLDQPSANEVCGACHDYSTHSAHPLGEKAINPRNKNLRVDCLSCHRGHGTEFKWMLLAATNTELCTQCHKQFGR